MFLEGLKSNLPDTLIFLKLEFSFASTNSKSDSFRNSDELKKPAVAFGATTNGFSLKPSRTLSLTFHLPIAEGSVSSLLLSSPDKK